MTRQIARLHDRARGNEKPREFDRLLKRPATIVPEIEDNALHVFAFQLAEQLRDIRRGRFLMPRFAGVEGGKINDPEARRLAAGVWKVDDLRLRLLFVEMDFIALDGHRFAHILARSGRNNREGHIGALGAADQVHRLGERHIHEIDRRFSRLVHGHDPVAVLKFSAERGRAAGHQLTNFAKTVGSLQRCANAGERKVHDNVEAL